MDEVGSGRAALSGLIAAGVALGVTELAAGILPTVPSFVVAIGDAVIDKSPGWFVRFGIDNLGTDDKPALVAGIVVISLLIGAGLGLVARWRRPVAGAGFAAFAVVGVLAASRLPFTSVPWSVATGVLGAGAGIATLMTLLRWAAPSPAPSTGAAGFDRRRFLVGAGGFALVAATTALVGRRLLDTATAAAERLGLPLPRPATPAPPLPTGAGLAVDGLTPLLTPNADFYRIDVELTVPRYSAKDWVLQVAGEVDAPYQLTYDELMALPMVEEYATMACVSNLVGGPLVGNARWQGVPLADIVNRARPHAGADQIVGRSIDGFTAGMPTALALDGRTALVAVGMNGEPLPDEHGFPVRLVVAGLYGYVSATKWLTELQLTRFASFDPYWVQLGWDPIAPVLPESRIDVPGNGRRLAAGRQTVAGVAWAPVVGISRVEVQVDDGPWADATLAEAINASTWRQWAFPWDAPSGRHVLRVRATDGNGVVQSAEQRDPFPNAATGYHQVVALVD
jgi:DMSO/TMAO reductase YedYZ molybdopterin-dependent catalytic subunit